MSADKAAHRANLVGKHDSPLGPVEEVGQRWRQTRADAGGAKFAGRDHMISALKTLQLVHEGGADMAGQQQPSFQALKISGKTGGLLALFASHPPLEERIARLEHPSV